LFHFLRVFSQDIRDRFLNESFIGYLDKILLLDDFIWLAAIPEHLAKHNFSGIAADRIFGHQIDQAGEVFSTDRDICRIQTEIVQVAQKLTRDPRTDRPGGTLRFCSHSFVIIGQRFFGSEQAGLLGLQPILFNEATGFGFVEQYELKPQESRLLTSEKALADYYEAVAAKSKSPARTVSSWIAGELLRYLNDLSLDPVNIPFPAEDLARLIDLVTENTISGNSGKVVLGEMFRNGGRPDEIYTENNLALESFDGFIQ
jgi:hypothetical protein